jgi:pyridoxamine 5'-phosphate oxidase
LISLYRARSPEGAERIPGLWTCNPPEYAPLLPGYSKCRTVVHKKHMQSTPPFYNDLTQSLTHAWALLARGTADRRSAFHTPSIASIGLDGAPTQRTMILRKADSQARTLRFHTDIRSAKIAESQQNPRVSILGYSVSDKIQLRLSGVAHIEKHSELADNVWANMRDQSRVGYAQQDMPGKAIDAPDMTVPPIELRADEPLAEIAREHFCLFIVEINCIDWVYLNVSGNRRAQFSWSNGNLTSRWLAP